MGFNSQPPEGGWLQLVSLRNPHISVSTHSRPKAAGTNTDTNTDTNTVSTHSRPKAAGLAACLDDFGCLFQLTAARRRLGKAFRLGVILNPFQLAAARRRLVPPLKPLARKACITLFR